MNINILEIFVFRNSWMRMVFLGNNELRSLESHVKTYEDTGDHHHYIIRDKDGNLIRSECQIHEYEGDDKKIYTQYGHTVDEESTEQETED